MNKLKVNKTDKIIENISLNTLLNKTIIELKMSGHRLDYYENAFNAYGQLFLNIKDCTNSIALKIYSDTLVLGEDNIVVELNETPYTQDNQTHIIYYAIEKPFTVASINVFGQKGDFQFEGTEIKKRWFSSNEAIPECVNLNINTENAIMLISTDNRRIFIAHDTAPRFEIATSETHIEHILSQKYGFKNGYFQLQRVIK